MTEITEQEYIELLFQYVIRNRDYFDVWDERGSNIHDPRKIRELLQDPELRKVTISMNGNGEDHFNMLSQYTSIVKTRNNIPRLSDSDRCSIYTTEMAKYVLIRKPVGRYVERYIDMALENDLRMSAYAEGFPTFSPTDTFHTVDDIVEDLCKSYYYSSNHSDVNSYLSIYYKKKVGDRNQKFALFIFPNHYTGKIEIHNRKSSINIYNVDPRIEFRDLVL